MPDLDALRLDIDHLETIQDVRDVFLLLLDALNTRFAALEDRRTGANQGLTTLSLEFYDDLLVKPVFLGAGVYFALTAQKAATLTGFAGGSGGRVVVIKNDSTKTWTVAHESTTALEAQRVRTRTGAAATLTAGSALVLVYDDLLSRWVVMGTQP